jgi:Tat protein secretion system quality control protein TatD with DNase activity
MMPTPEILAHLVDVHCHPTVAPVIAASTIESLPCTLCAMSSREGDQSMVAALARARPDRIVPGFGYHPWWAHRISLSAPAGTVTDHAAHYRALFLPESSSSSSSSPSSSAELEEAFDRLLPNLPPPISLADVLADVRLRLTEFPTAMLGEVGIDRAARIPWAGTVDAASSVGGTNGRTLSPFSTPFAHQLAILEAQLALAVELRRNVSLHSVKASAQTREMFDKMAATHGAAWFAISVDVHSCTLSPEVWLGIEVRPFYLLFHFHLRLYSRLHFPPQRRRRREERLLMRTIEAPSECILVTLDGYQLPFTWSHCPHPSVCTNSHSCRVRLPRCMRCAITHLGHGVYRGRYARVANRGCMGRHTTYKLVPMGRCPATRGELAIIRERRTCGASKETHSKRAA